MYKNISHTRKTEHKSFSNLWMNYNAKPTNNTTLNTMNLKSTKKPAIKKKSSVWLEGDITHPWEAQ